MIVDVLKRYFATTYEVKLDANKPSKVDTIDIQMLLKIAIVILVFPPNADVKISS